MFCAILRIFQPHNGVLKPTEKGREIDPLTRHILNSLLQKIKTSGKKKNQTKPTLTIAQYT